MKVVFVGSMFLSWSLVLAIGKTAENRLAAMDCCHN